MTHPVRTVRVGDHEAEIGELLAPLIATLRVQGPEITRRLETRRAGEPAPIDWSSVGR
ncbi:hypothetical protein AB0J83_28565 [Actinoplanes sp. NPDC049596]|uniref:hypothetical protein n=1 Tax=unclassified Actinoplanes TaxID=2626549 RepID=UPI0034460194